MDKEAHAGDVACVGYIRYVEPRGRRSCGVSEPRRRVGARVKLRDLPARAVVSLVLTVVGALFWLLSFLAGCATVPVIMMPQPTIADAAWACVGGHGPTPAVQILGQDELTCRNSPGEPMMGFGCGTVKYHMAPSTPCVCYAGLEHGSPIQVARPGVPPIPWSQTALTHELNHRALLQNTGDEDAYHTGATWTTVVAGCNQRLRDTGE